ncbi:unnamed protein product [Nyctereutes procyonoides]|uniref:(raccoon dog) hypothetical protein n=1 Tax=Nyctereutes procyonoides TaxID=34880 RepID=A0A811YM48_NYCPR|nr:unnamed protein product [Nyctereutes procyonoides]|eukprot:XP_022273414.1 uncharacterized protein LOC111095545 isoform X4 [Canis lupus familiaris]
MSYHQSSMIRNLEAHKKLKGRLEEEQKSNGKGDRRKTECSVAKGVPVSHFQGKFSTHWFPRTNAEHSMVCDIQRR